MFSSLTMSKKQLLACCVGILTVFFLANALLTLLPVYVIRMGADPALTGLYLSFSFATLSVGTFGAGWISDRFQRRKTPLLIAVAASILPTWLMGQATTLTALTLFTATSWFLIGVALALVNILAGMSAGENERGKVFGALGVAVALGGLIAGLTIGPITDRWGYSVMFVAAALALVLFFLSALLLEDKPIPRDQRTATASLAKRLALPRGFYLLFLANMLAFLALFVTSLGRPLMMNSFGFDSTSITSTIAVASAVTLPLPLLAGGLSDRLGRRRLIALCYLAGGIGLLVLIPSVVLWHFWLSTALVAAIGAGGSVAAALVTDLVPSESLGTGLALYNTAGTIAGIIGFVAAGGVMQTFGMGTTFLLGAFLPVFAVCLLLGVRLPMPTPKPA